MGEYIRVGDTIIKKADISTISYSKYWDKALNEKHSIIIKHEHGVETIEYKDKDSCLIELRHIERHLKSDKKTKGGNSTLLSRVLRKAEMGGVITTVEYNSLVEWLISLGALQ